MMLVRLILIPDTGNSLKLNKTLIIEIFHKMYGLKTRLWLDCIGLIFFLIDNRLDAIFLKHN